MKTNILKNVLLNSNSAREKLQLHLDNPISEIISFSGQCTNYCICIVDMVDSTKTIAYLSKKKLCRYYSIFLNSMAEIACDYGATVVKNLGDSLLYYFPNESNTTNPRQFLDCIESGLIMLDVHGIVNNKMKSFGLPLINYRVSADYGTVMLARQVNSLNDDIFGPSVNMCAKINSCAKTNGMAVGNDLYQIVRGCGEYKFEPIKSYSSGLKLQYPVYTIKRR